MVLALVVGGGAAAAAPLITGADIKNGSVISKDIKNNNLLSKDLKDGTVGSADVKNGSVASGDIKDGTVGSGDLKNGGVASGDIKDGTVGTQDLSQATIDSVTPKLSGVNWGVVDRNVIGAGSAALRPGPTVQLPKRLVKPPMGVGSLGISTGSDQDKAAFGNQVDFAGDLVSALTTVSFSVYTTTENINEAPVAVGNMPSITFEIDPNLTGVRDNFASMVFVPGNSAPGVWKNIVASDDAAGAVWGLTGKNMPCPINGGRCTFTDLKAALDDGAPEATILTVQITKGRDFAFSGAVDELQINGKTFDFEPTGVIKR